MARGGQGKFAGQSCAQHWPWAGAGPTHPESRNSGYRMRRSPVSTLRLALLFTLCAFYALRFLRCALFSLSAFYALRFFRLALFTLSAVYALRFLRFALFSLCAFYALRFFRFALFSLCAFCALRFLRFALFALCGDRGPRPYSRRSAPGGGEE